MKESQRKRRLSAFTAPHQREAVPSTEEEVILQKPARVSCDEIKHLPNDSSTFLLYFVNKY